MRKKTPWYKLALRPHELRDFSIYCAIGVSIATSIPLWLFYALPQYNENSRWILLFWCTLFVFGVAISASREYFKLLRFWIAAVCLIVLHFAGAITLFLKLDDWNLKAHDIALVVMLEILALILIFEVVGEKDIRILWNPLAVYAKKYRRKGNSTNTD